MITYVGLGVYLCSVTLCADSKHRANGYYPQKNKAKNRTKNLVSRGSTKIYYVTGDIVMWTAIKRQVYGLFQVMRLHSALSQSNMQVHSLRRSGDGRYLARVSPMKKGMNGKAFAGSASPFKNVGLVSKMSGRSERLANEDRFAEYFAEAMNEQAIDLTDGMGLVPYEEFSMDRKISTRKASEWGLRAMLRNFGCDVEEAEMVSDAGYGSHWIAVAFSPA